MKKVLLLPIMLLVSVGLKAGATEDLFTATWRNLDGLAAAAINAGADVEATDHFGWTPLIIALKFNRINIVERLLTAGAKVKAKNNN